MLCGWEQMVGVCCVAGNRGWECVVWLGTEGGSVLCETGEQTVGVCCVTGNRWWECVVWLGTDGGSVLCGWEQRVGVCCVRLGTYGAGNRWW